MKDNHVLFRNLQAGALELPHRIVMAPLTRCRSTDRIPNDLMAEYYRQRSSAALILSEATAISSQGYGWPGSPGIYNEAQIEGWQKVTAAVHEAEGRIFLQLWHLGRLSHPDYQDGKPPVGPSSIPVAGMAHTPAGKKPFVVPRELTAAEIAEVVKDYASATRNAREAGFDGVEIHGANGYLVDQFLRDSSNQRQDEYGGTIENRMRFLREVIEAVADAWSSDRTGLRLSPTMNEKGMKDSNPIQLYSQVASMLNEYDLAYLHTAEPIRPGLLYNPEVPRVTPYIRQRYNGVLIVNGGYDKHSAADAIRHGEADAVSFGQSFISNPDLPVRFLFDAPLTVADQQTYYTTDSKGYTDYPALTNTWEGSRPDHRYQPVHQM